MVWVSIHTWGDRGDVSRSLIRSPMRRYVSMHGICHHRLLSTHESLDGVRGWLGHREALDSGEYALAFALCTKCLEALEALTQRQQAERGGEGLREGEGLVVCGVLASSVQRFYTETEQRLSGALAAVCIDFEPARYLSVLEGFAYLAGRAWEEGEGDRCAHGGRGGGR